MASGPQQHRPDGQDGGQRHDDGGHVAGRVVGSHQAGRAHAHPFEPPGDRPDHPCPVEGEEGAFDQVAQGGAPGEQQSTPDEDEHRDDELEIDTVPQVEGRRVTGDGVRRDDGLLDDRSELVDREGERDADQDRRRGGKDGDPAGLGHRPARLRSVEEGAGDDLAAVEEGQDRAEPRHRQQDRPRDGGSGRVEQRSEDVLLGDESQQRGDTRHRRRAHECHGEGDRHGAAQGRQPIDHARACLVVDQAHHHEETGLEAGVSDRVEQGGSDREGRADPDRGRDQAELADRGVGHELLEVDLLHREPGREHRGEKAQPDEQNVPDEGAVEDDREAEEQVDPRLHHGRRVQVGADRGRCGHRVGQPQVERELGGLAEAGGGHEHRDQPGEGGVGPPDR